MSNGRGHLSGGLTAAAAVLLVSGGVAWVLQLPTSSTSDLPDLRTSPAVTSAAPDATPAAEPVLAPVEPGAPRRVVIRSLGVDAPVLPIKTVGDTLVPPSNPQQLGWWADGARPGARRGSALVTGHTVHTGGGALDDLESLEVGDEVVVRTAHGRITYAVDRVRVFSKGAIAKESERLFSQEVSGRLVLITCEDWNGTRYLSNVVVTATPRR